MFHFIIQEQAILFDISTFERNIYAAIMVNNEQSKIYVKDIIGEDYKAWNRDKIFFDCGTGTGKTSFILGTFLNHARYKNKRVLYLVNRKALYRELAQTNKSKKYIDFMTYQAFEVQLREKDFSEDKYHFIVADECHYFLSDSFNNQSDISLNYLLNNNKHTVIYMSATAKWLKNYLMGNKHLKNENTYSIPTDYSYIKAFTFISAQADIFELIDDLIKISEKEKIICFFSKKDSIRKAKDKFGDMAYYVTSDNVSTQEVIKPLGNRSTFDKRLLFTTKVLDNGINIDDEDVKHIISDIWDIDTIIQCFGRKRIHSSSDTCNFYLLDYKKNQYAHFLKSIEEQLMMAELYIDYKTTGKNEEHEYVAQILNNRDFIKQYDIFYLGYCGTGTFEYKLNRAKYYKALEDRKFFTSIETLSDYRKIVLDAFGCNCKVAYLTYQDNLLTDEQRNELCEYLALFLGQRLFKDEKNKFKSSVCRYFELETARMTTLNKRFKDEKIPYMLEATRGTNGVQGWKVITQ